MCAEFGVVLVLGPHMHTLRPIFWSAVSSHAEYCFWIFLVSMPCLGACSDAPYGKKGETPSGPFHAHAKGVIGYAGDQVNAHTLLHVSIFGVLATAQERRHAYLH